MRIWLTLAALPLLAATAPALPDPVQDLAGRYSHHFLNGDVNGGSFSSDDVAEIVPVDPNHAYIRFELNFFNGHSCSLAGVAEARGSELIYRGLGNQNSDGSKCRLHVRHDATGLSWSDEGGTCKSYCGVRGSFLGDSLPWSSKRSIRYMARLKGSEEYRAAMTEWRTGKPTAP